jgi:hypothetical protein
MKNIGSKKRRGGLPLGEEALSIFRRTRKNDLA